MGLSMRQNTTAAFNATTTPTATFANTPLAGSTIGVCFSVNGATGTAVTGTSGCGAKWHNGSGSLSAAGGVLAETGGNADGVNSTVTVTLTAAASGTIEIFEFVGATTTVTSGPGAPTYQLSNTGSGTGPTSGTISPSGSGWVGLLAGIAWSDTTNTVTAQTNGWTSGIGGTNGGVSLATAYVFGPAATLPTVETLTLSGSATRWSVGTQAIADANAIFNFYFHDATATVVGTAPGSTTLSASTPTVTATGASTNRAMNGTIGVAQTSVVGTCNATTSAQSQWLRRYVSPPLVGGTMQSTATPTIFAGAAESNTNSNFSVTQVLAIWRPTTGAIVGRLCDLSGTGAVSTTTEAAINWGPTLSTLTWLDGDLLVAEIWRASTAQSMSTAYTNTFFYDGTSATSATSNAANLDLISNSSFAMLLLGPKPRPVDTIIEQAVARSTSI